MMLASATPDALAARQHAAIRGNCYLALRKRLRGSPYAAYAGGIEVRGPGVSALPAVVVESSLGRPRDAFVTEPVLIAEIDAPAFEPDDLAHRWQGYCLIPSLKHYMIVAQLNPFVILHTRIGPFSWHERMFQEGTIELEAFGIGIGVDEIYEGITFAEEPADG